jgi:hypothetical protein
MAESHWFDRLAAPRTRRQTFKVALAGALATLPLGRVRFAHAAAEQCTYPCMYSSQVQTARAKNSCDNLGLFGGIASYTALWVNPIAYAASTANLLKDLVACEQHADLVAKATQFDCIQPGCGSWQPNPDILCPGCKEAGGTCCPAPSYSSGSGYLCCSCCADNGDGCKVC